MDTKNIYGNYKTALEATIADIQERIQQYCREEREKSGINLAEHIVARIKSEESMLEKCRRRGLDPTPYSALRELTDAIGLRIVCGFIDDVYTNVEKIKQLSGCTIICEKDYINHAKPNGYRSYHMILSVEEPFEDIEGDNPGHFYVEVQLRTIAMDSWASLEHHLKYKKNIPFPCKRSEILSFPARTKMIKA